MKQMPLYIQKRKAAVIFTYDLFAVTAALFIAFFAVYTAPKGAPVFHFWLLFMLVFKLTGFAFFLGYRISLRYICFKDLARLFAVLVAVFCAALSLNIFFYISESRFVIPFRFLLIDLFAGFMLHGGGRVMRRLLIEFKRSSGKSYKQKKAVIIGAGYSGERIVREMLRSPSEGMLPIAFFDDDEGKQNSRIHNIPVVGKLDGICIFLADHVAEMAVISMPNASTKVIRDVYQSLKKCGIDEIKIIRSIRELEEQISVTKQLSDINISDLLYREEVHIDRNSISELIAGKEILVTGAAGSIGSEIVRQAITFKPSKIIAYEIDETELFHLNNEILKMAGDVKFLPVVGDVRDAGKIKSVFAENNIEMVFHASAYKHVPLMEDYPEEAVKTNIIGTYNLTHSAAEYGAKYFINISTDKAVNPTSVMGATKRVTELICSAFNSSFSTSYISVRFGNVLGSRGSVIPIFIEQIKNGGPVTVTDPEMKRYFMTIPEAVLLVFQASALGKGGEVFVLDMGEPVKISQLAENLIRLNNLSPYNDIDIVYTGLRPGEKLFEELLTAEEGTDATMHSKIYKAVIKFNFSFDEITEMVAEFERTARNERHKVKELLKRVVPFYEENKAD
ncbi:MAG: polysaccharide biosynthesis protein [Deferribacterales bacterium]